MVSGWLTPNLVGVSQGGTGVGLKTGGEPLDFPVFLFFFFFLCRDLDWVSGGARLNHFLPYVGFWVRKEQRWIVLFLVWLSCSQDGVVTEEWFCNSLWEMFIRDDGIFRGEVWARQKTRGDSWVWWRIGFTQGEGCDGMGCRGDGVRPEKG